jgi:hypothetical protein
MRYFFLLGTVVLFLTGCSDILTPTGEFTVVNAADRPFAVIVFDAELKDRIDLIPAFSADEFEHRKIDVGTTAVVDHKGYDKGNDAYVVIYAQCDCVMPGSIESFAGPDAAIFIKDFVISADLLRLWNYHVVVEDL